MLHAACVSAAPFYKTNEIKFATHDGDLPWPLPDSNDLTSLLIHAVHCKNMVALNNSKTEMGKMHVKHCTRVVEEIKAQPVPDVSKSLCELLFGLSAKYYTYRAKLGSYSYYADDELHKVNKGELLNTPTDALAHLAGYNYGTLLMKEWTNPKDLTPAEKDYLESWFSRVHLAQSAIAYRCEALGVTIYQLKDEPGRHGEFRAGKF